MQNLWLLEETNLVSGQMQQPTIAMTFFTHCLKSLRGH